MRFLIDAWRRIGTRLYIALGFAVFLTLVSSMVGVYYFERSGDLNFQVRSESVPMLEAAWSAAREGERVRVLGLGLLSDPDSTSVDSPAEPLEATLKRLEADLGVVGAVPALTADAEGVYDDAFDLAEVVDALALNRDALSEANTVASELRSPRGIGLSKRRGEPGRVGCAEPNVLGVRRAGVGQTVGRVRKCVGDRRR